MLQINLTLKEALIMYGFLEGVLKSVNEKPDLELIDRENTTAAIESIMSKVVDQIDLQTNNN